MNVNMQFLLRSVSRILFTGIRVFSLDGGCKDYICMNPDLDDTLLFTAEIEQALLSSASEFPSLIDVNHIYNYAALRLGDQVLILGPVKSNLHFSSRIHFDVALPEEAASILSRSVKELEWDICYSVILMLANTFAPPQTLKNEITVQDFLSKNCLPNDYTRSIRARLETMLFHQIENGMQHNSYDQEIRERTSIENGDVESLQKSIDELFVGNVGRLADDKLRNNKNLAIVAITLASRAAIQGGLAPETAFSMSDLYIRQVEQAASTGLPIQITRNAEFQFARMVKELRESNISSSGAKENEHISNCKKYIFRHLHGRIQVKEIAEAIGLNANYLSTIFKKSEGLSISEYIMRQKIILVKNLLTYSNYTLLEITHYLGFVSQSHLGEQFKKKTGMTPKQYRIRYQVQEFN